MHPVIAAKFANVIAAVQTGTDIEVAFEHQFGPGSYAKLAGLIQDDLRVA